MTRGRLIAIAITLVAVLIAMIWWARRGDDAPARAGAGSAAAADQAAVRDDGPERTGRAGIRRGGGPREAGEVEVTGRVVDDTGAGISGVDVVFSRKLEEAVTSGPDGEFAIAVEPGKYDVRALGDGLYGVPTAVAIAEDTAPLTVTVTRLARARGWVVDAAGKPVAGATVAVNVAVPIAKLVEKDGVFPSVTTDRNGVFELDILPEYTKLTADHATAGHGRLDLERIPPGESEEDLRIQLAPVPVIRGVVRSPDGVGVSGAEVTGTLRATAIRRTVTATTGPDGRFTLQVVPGEVTIDAKIEGFAPADPIKIKVVESPLDEVGLQLNLPVTLAGRVVDDTGEPVYDAKVQVKRVGSDHTFRAIRTDVDGSFEVTGIDDGPHTVTVVIDGRVRLTRELTAVSTAPLDLALEP